MKRIMTMTAFLFLALFSFSAANAQTTDSSKSVSASEDYFVGRWKTQILGIPQGDTEVTFTFEKKDGRLTGSMLEPKQNISAEFTNVKVTGDVLTSNVTVQGFYASLSLRKRDSVNFAGSVMETFDVLGARMK